MESKDNNNEDLTSRPGSIRSMPHGLRKGLLVVCLLAFLIASLWALRTWPTRWAWHQTIQALHLAGESIDQKDFIPPPIPDEENFAAQPLFQDLFQGSIVGRGSAQWKSLYAPDPDPFSEDWPMRKRTDIGDLLKILTYVIGRSQSLPPDAFSQPAQALLDLLKRADPTVNELESFLNRPRFRMPLKAPGEDGLFPIESQTWVLQMWSYMNQHYLVRSLCWLALGQSDQAWDGWKKLWKLQNYLDGELGLRPVLVAQQGREFALHILWEGWINHAWSEAQLREGEALLRDSNVLPTFRHAVQSQRAWDLYSLQRPDREAWWFYWGGGGLSIHSVWSPWIDWPSGKGLSKEYLKERLAILTFKSSISQADWDQACVQTCRDYDSISRMLYFKPEGTWVFRPPEQWLSQDGINGTLLVNYAPESAFAALSLAATQCKIRAARIAFLSRLYQQVHVNWPQSLDDIRPPFEPFAFHDTFTDTDLKYLPPRTPENRPTITSPGPPPLPSNLLHHASFSLHPAFPGNSPITWSGQPE